MKENHVCGPESMCDAECMEAAYGGAPLLEVCDACGGDGGFDDTYIDTSHEVRSDWHPCSRCCSTGSILIDAEPIEMEDMA